MADAFDRFQGTDSDTGDAFDRFPINEESFGKSAFRTAAQIPQGIAEATGPGLAAGLFQLLAAGETDLDVEDWQRVRKAYEDKGELFDEDAYESGRQQALSYIPTVSNIASAIESKTGIPLDPKTRTQKGLRFASMAGKAIPKPNPTAPKGYTFRGANTGLPRPVLGAGIEGVRELLLEMGLPEFAADVLSFGAIKPTSATSGIFNVGKEQKPSGLTTRRFEGIEKPTEVSPKTLTRINENAEREFRDITKNIIKESPIKETHESLSRDVSFKKNALEGFKQVENLSESLPNQFDSKAIKKDLNILASKKSDTGLTPSEFDKSHNKFIKQFVEETPDRSFTAKEIVSQYRKNNKQLSEAYEPGQSFAYNRAKREALLDYNRLLAEMIEKEFPNSQFANLFKETNKRWADISNSEAITGFLDKLFKDEKPNFKTARQLFEKDGMTVPFKRAMGEEGFAKFETLINDLLSQEQGYKLLKKAEDQGSKEFIKLASSYLVHPNVATAKAGWNILKGGYNTIYNMVIDKPKLAVTWDRAINAAKKGDFKAAQKEFSIVKAAEEAFDKKEIAKKAAIKKFKENSQTEVPKNTLKHANEELLVAQNKNFSKDFGTSKIESQNPKIEEKNIEIKNIKDKDRSRFSNIKEAEDGKGNFLGSLAYDIEPNGEIYISGINVDPPFRNKGIGKKLFKDILIENPGKNIILSPLQPEGAEFFSKILDRKLKPQLTKDYDKIKGISQEPIRLTEKDIKKAKENLNISNHKTNK